ncbi:hypothetical protein CBS101457_000344 [Exobasidium rhododendri]|nr:hypothetical protein CBS101457_000344 [Exobasidium rhododendri]
MVAPSKTQISENPANNAVTLAQDAKFKEADVNRKMKFYGVIQAFRNGRMPDNKQIDAALVYTERNSPVDVSKLSSDGQTLVKDIREIIATMRQMVLEKNANEEFQNFVYHTTKADVKGNVGLNPAVSKEDAQKDKETAGEALRTLVKLFLRNGEARKLFQDLGLVGRDVFADAAQFAAGKARPDEDRLAAVDQPAPDNEFHDDVPESFRKAQRAKNEAGNVAQEHADGAANAVDPDATEEENKQALSNQAGKLQNTISAKIPDKHKDIAREHKDKTVDYLKENFPEERRDQFVYRLKKVLVECQRHKDYQDAMDFFLTAFENYKGVAKDTHAQMEGNAKNLGNHGPVDTAQSTFRTLIERFANGKPTQPIVDALDVIYNDVAKDPELKNYFSKLDTYVRRSVQEPGFVMKDEANTQATQLQKEGQKFFTGRTREVAPGQTVREKGKYEPHFENLFDQIKIFFTAMGDDPLNKKFGDKWHKMGRDLFFNSEGKATFKPHLWDDIRDPILPQLLQHIGYVPVPRIEYTDPMVDLVIENLNVDPANLIPNLIEIDAHHYHKMSAYKKIRDNHRGSVKILLSQIQTDLRDVAWAINKKKGFPSLKDSGLADVFLGGNGLTVSVTLETSTGDRNVFRVKEVKAKIQKIDFAIRKSKHDILVKILRPLATSLIKTAVCKAAEGGIRDALEKLNEHLTIAKEAEEGKKVDTLKARMSKTEEQKNADSKASFKIPTSKRDSILPQMGIKDGWVNRLDAAQEKADSTGGKNDWHSPAFTIVPTSGVNGNVRK